MATQDDWIGIGIAVTSIALTICPLVYSALFGGRYQRRLVEDCHSRESEFMARYGGDNLSNLRSTEPSRPVASTGLVLASVVVGASWWQLFVGFLHGLIGGRLESFDTVLGFARRESMQRLREEAERQGYDSVVNMRLEIFTMAMQTNSKSKVSGVEILAYGTGVRYAERETPAPLALPSSV